jgi:hypothetical protein
LSASSSPFKRLVFFLVLAVAAIALVAGWLLSNRPSEPLDQSSAADSAAASAPFEPRQDAQPRRQLQPPPGPKPDEHVADDGIGFMPKHEGEGAPPGMLHPHRVTEQHRRNFEEIRIAAAIDDAMDAKDVPVMKELLEQYRRDFPEDSGDLQSGYAIVIDCFERPGPETRAAADRWIDHHNGSTIKRAVLRHCIEPQQP